jgi:hypothetical protein
MKAVIRISTRLRSAAPIPRDFMPIPGLEHLGLIYQQKIITSPEEFNETLARVSESRFPSRGCQFFPYMLTAEDLAKMSAIPAPEYIPPAPEAKYIAAVDPSTEQEDKTTPKFTLVDKGIFVGEERVAGLFGDEKNLRVLSAYSDLRPEIEAWLLTLTPSDL